MNPKVKSSLSHLSILWLVAYLSGEEQSDDLISYHLKQGLLVVVLLFNIIVSIVLLIFPSLATILSLLSIVFLILMVLRSITASNEVKKLLTLIGKPFEYKFDFIGK